jgi:transcriptional regulator with XRE-family HTH domain
MNEKVAQRIKELRLKTGLSQEGLSHLADLDRKYIGIIEKGNTNVSIQVLSQICEALDVSLSEFFEEFDN